MISITQENESKQLIKMTENSNSTKYEKLGYQESPDDILNMTYAFLAYKVIDVRTGDWKIKIDGTITAGTVMYPDKIKKKCSNAARELKKYIVIGFDGLSKKNSLDARLIEHRVYFNKFGQPTYVEMILISRYGDGSARETVVTKFDWPKK